jgi:hypothetical protein
MKSPIAALALFGTLAASPVWAQSLFQPPPSRSALPNAPLPSPSGATNNSAPNDNKVVPGSAVPEPTPVHELRPPTVELPNEPIEPYLLSKENGPFMVMAKTFRGVDAERMALALVKELKHEHQLPAYILRTKDMPGKSLIRGTPPTAPNELMAPDIKMPEKIRTFDEAAVLVGNERTLADSERLLKQVRKIKPKCLDGMSSMFPWRTALCYAYRTTNPYAPAQALFPRSKDRLVVQINSGHRSIVNCPGRYSLQVAQFTGRTQYQIGDQSQQFQILSSLRDLKDSPLRTAHDDAERMAEKLANDPDVQRLGQPIYVYHDRTSSQVFVGSFNSDRDAAAIAAHEQLLKLAVPLMNKKRRGGGLDIMIVPANSLTDLAPIKAKLQ